MTHTFIDTDKINWGDYIRQQQRGEGKVMDGRDDIDKDDNYFEGVRYMRGYGIRDALSSVGRFLLPIASNLMESAKGEAKEAMGRIGADVMEGKPILETIKEQGKAGLKNIGTKVQQYGKGRKRRRRIKLIGEISGEQKSEPIISGPQPLFKKRRRKDYLDL